MTRAMLRSFCGLALVMGLLSAFANVGWVRRGRPQVGAGSWGAPPRNPAYEIRAAAA
jgi:hypothetical protein